MGGVTMKRLLVLLALFISASPALAEVSADLKFCGGLKSSAERLACYDAAARIASVTKPQPRSVVVQQEPAPVIEAMAYDHGPVSARPVTRSNFDGLYAAIGGGYGASTGRTFDVSGPFSYRTNFWGYGDKLGTMDGPSGKFTVGGNIANGWGLVGLEFQGRFFGEGADLGKQFTAHGYYGVTGLATYSYKYRNDAGLHTAIRAGVIAGDTLIFAKLGVGASRVTETFTADERGLSVTYCSNSRYYYYDCVFPGTTPPGYASTKVSTWLPSAVIGLGVEQNWGRLFGSMGAEFEFFNHTSTDLRRGPNGVFGGSSSAQLTWTARGTAMVGVRF